VPSPSLQYRLPRRRSKGSRCARRIRPRRGGLSAPGRTGARSPRTRDRGQPAAPRRRPCRRALPAPPGRGHAAPGRATSRAPRGGARRSGGRAGRRGDRPRSRAGLPLRLARRAGAPWRRGQSRPEVAEIRSVSSRAAAASTRYGLAGRRAGSAGARGFAGRSCSGRRRGSRTDNSCCAGRPRNSRHTSAMRRSCRSDNLVRRQSGRPGTPRRRRASRLPLSAHPRSPGRRRAALAEASAPAGQAEYMERPIGASRGGAGFSLPKSQNSGAGGARLAADEEVVGERQHFARERRKPRGRVAIDRAGHRRGAVCGDAEVAGHPKHPEHVRAVADEDGPLE
jgi:hypothetical protein